MSDTDELLEATTALILPLLHALDALNQAGRLMHPPAVQEVVEVAEEGVGGIGGVER